MLHGNTPRMVMKRLPCPCYKCEDRVMGCHSSCKRYAQYKNDYCAERVKMKAVYKNEQRIENYAIKATRRMQKANHHDK